MLPEGMSLETALSPGALGEIVALHGRHYAAVLEMGPVFEAKVAADMAAFALRRQADDLVLVARDGEGVAASLFLDLHHPASGDRGARLRWFFATDRCRGKGIGRAFMDRAIAHADARTGGRMWLTTVAGLDAARHLYESYGFVLAAEAEAASWGRILTEQEFRRV